MPVALREKDSMQFVTPTLNTAAQARAWVESVVKQIDDGAEILRAA